MPRFKSSVPTLQAPRPSRSYRESLSCPNEYCRFTTHSEEEHVKHEQNCPLAPYRVPTVKRRNSAATINVEGALDRLSSEKNDQVINGNGLVPNERDGSISRDDAASSSSLSDPPGSNFSENEVEFGGMSRAARKLLDDTVSPYSEEKSVYYETVKEVKAKPSPALQNLDETEASTNEASTPVDEAQDSDGPSMPPTPKGPKNSDDVKSGKYPFPEFTEIRNFEEYLAGAPEMEYDELYHRTSVITQTLMLYQSEWDGIDKEVRNYEESQRLKGLTAAEKAKVASDERQAEEDMLLAALEHKFRLEILLPRKLWVEEFSTQFLAENPDGQTTLDLLNKLRDQVFRKGFQKRQRALNDNPTEELVDKPLPEAKQTKEERDLEARKRRFLTDAITFDDMNQADAYGFTYIASDLARGNQLPGPKLRVVGMPRGIGIKVASRPNRNATKGFVAESADNSEAPSAAEEELPQKRSRAKPKKLEDDANEVSSAAETSRPSSAKTYLGADGIRRYIGSNKPSGRPAAGNKSTLSKATTKSKLDQMSLAASEQVEQPNGIKNREHFDVNTEGELSNGQVLALDQANELQQAAESLINQTSPVTKRRGPGRPKKGVRLAQRQEIDYTPNTAPKPKGKGGRKKKVQPEQGAVPVEAGDVTPVVKAKGKPGRKKRVRDEDAENEAGSVAKRAKSEEATTISAKSTKKLATNGAIKTGDRQGGQEVPLTSLDSYLQTRRSSRPTTSSSKVTGSSRPQSQATSRRSSPGASRAASKSRTKAAKSKVNGKRARDDDDEDSRSTTESPEYSSSEEDDDGPPPPKKQRIGTLAGKRKAKSKSTKLKLNVDPHIRSDNAAGEPKKAKPSTKRKLGALEDEINGEGNTGDATDDDTDGEDGTRANKKSKKSREKTEAEKASQAAAMRNKWADVHGKMRQGIERRKRRVARKQLEKSRNGDPDRPGFCYKSDQEGFDYAYFNEVAPYGGSQVPATVPTPAVIAQDERDPAEGQEDEDDEAELEEEEEEEVKEEEDEEEEAEFVVEAPRKIETGRPTALTLTTTRSGRQSKPSRKANAFGMDGADDDSDDSHERPAGHTQKSESTYDEFQKLTSPGHQLGKRISKQLYQVNYDTTSDDEEF